METMKQLLSTLLLVCSVTLLSACGGGGGGDGDKPEQPKSFTVQLVGVEANRMSNGDSVTVDSTDISSDSMTYTP